MIITLIVTAIIVIVPAIFLKVAHRKNKKEYYEVDILLKD